jgi:hypothetical protein
VRTAIFSLILLGFVQTARAEDCQDHFNDLLWTVQEPHSAWELNSKRKGEVFLGTSCDPAFIKSWFATAGWRLVAEETRKPEDSGPFGHGTQSYLQDRVLVFCLPREWPWRWVTEGCSMGVDISLYEGRITHVSTGAYQ